MILYAKEGIFANQTTEDVQELTATERAKNAIKRAEAVMASDKPEPEPLSAYDEYKALQLCKPVQAGEFWRSHKHEILACKFDD